jgi:hypothetical protein
MQVLKIDLAPNNPLLLNLKRKVVISKVQKPSHKTKKKSDTVVVNIPDMDGALAGAFEVLIIFSLSFLLS